MIDIAKIIEINKDYVKHHPALPKAGLTSHPTKKLGIVTCMDTCLVGMLEEALGFHRGEIIVIKTAGNSVTQLIDWMDRFHISEDNVIYTVNFLRHHPLFSKGMGFYGGMMDPDTGEFRYLEI